ncbi:hypothetical protein D3C87_2014350 [compost metagenome]
MWAVAVANERRSPCGVTLMPVSFEMRWKRRTRSSRSRAVPWGPTKKKGVLDAGRCSA